MKIICYLFALSILMFYSSVNAQWVHTNVSIGVNVNCFAVSGTNLFAGTEVGGVFLSTNDGTNWQEVNNGLLDKNVTSLTSSDSNIFVATYILTFNPPYSRGSIFRSTDSGANWQAVDTSLSDEKIKCLAISDSNIFAGSIDNSSGGIFRSTNNGTSWAPIIAAGRYTFVSSLVISDSNIFAGTDGLRSYVIRSSNNGATWTEDDTTFRQKGITAFAVSGTNLFAGTYSGVYLSTNSGSNWSPVNNGLPDYVHKNGWITKLAVSPNGAGGNNLFAGTDSAGVFLSTDNGTSWTAIGMTNYYINALTVNSTHLFVGTSDGIWRRPLSEILTGVEDQNNDIPSQFILEQNYPNPFNPSTTIKFQVPNASFVNLKVYDVLGKEVATLVNEEKPVGNYEVNFSAIGGSASGGNAYSLSSGIYLYKLQSGSFVETKKMILMK